MDGNYKQFLAKFEPVFQEYLLGLPSDTKSIDESVTSSFFEPLFPFEEGGKRLRPYLISVGAGNFAEKTLHAGVAFESFHGFILIHDDIMDGATKRRGKDAVHIAFEKYTPHGQWAGMLLGDYFCSATNEYVAKNVPELQDTFYEMQKFLFVGQYFELLHWGKEISEETSEKIEYFKSAQYTFMYPLQIGLRLSGLDQHMLDEYSRWAGLCFQMQNDWMDIDDADSGKDKGLDAENGVPNVVQILLSENGGDVAKTKIDVERRLGEYRDKAMSELDRVELGEEQKNQLREIVQFVSRVDV